MKDTNHRFDNTGNLKQDKSKRILLLRNIYNRTSENYTKERCQKAAREKQCIATGKKSDSNCFKISHQNHESKGSGKTILTCERK